MNVCGVGKEFEEFLTLMTSFIIDLSVDIFARCITPTSHPIQVRNKNLLLFDISSPIDFIKRLQIGILMLDFDFSYRNFDR